MQNEMTASSATLNWRSKLLYSNAPVSLESAGRMCGRLRLHARPRHGSHRQTQSRPSTTWSSNFALHPHAAAFCGKALRKGGGPSTAWRLLMKHGGQSRQKRLNDPDTRLLGRPIWFFVHRGVEPHTKFAWKDQHRSGPRTKPKHGRPTSESRPDGPPSPGARVQNCPLTTTSSSLERERARRFWSGHSQRDFFMSCRASDKSSVGMVGWRPTNSQKHVRSKEIIHMGRGQKVRHISNFST